VRQSAEVLAEVDRLVAGWCDRRSYGALRAILAGWPLTSGLTDDWGQLLDALEKVRAFAQRDLVGDELAQVEDLIRDVDRLVQRRLR
jgi:hypothetical protein